MAEMLGIGAAFPSMTVATTDGKQVSLPGDLPGRYKVILFYRGHW